jgi:predicted secreted protein
MIANLTSNLVLAADIPASGAFAVLGRMHVPNPALAAAVRDLEEAPADPELLDTAVYSLAANMAGLCILDSRDTANVLKACFAAQLAADWRIEIPGAGVLRALFTVARFEPAADTDRTFALALRLAGKPAFAWP